MRHSNQLHLGEHGRLLVLTGAGVSAESGLATFRAGGGLWEDHSVDEVATPMGFRNDPQLVWRFYSARREAAAEVEPNPGHQALARVEEQLGDRFLLVTQNVDGLHHHAGSDRVVEIHGNLFRSRCAHCNRAPFADRKSYGEDIPICDLCDQRGEMGLLRPDIVWFGESLDPDHLIRIERFLSQGQSQDHPIAFLAAGTSGTVYPAAGFVDMARRAGAQTWLVNADPADNTHRFDHFVQGKSAEVLPALLEASMESDDLK